MSVRPDTRSGVPLTVAPSPRTATNSWSRAGAASAAIVTAPSSTSATDTAQPVRPRMKSRVPSIGSTTQTRRAARRAGPLARKRRRSPPTASHSPGRAAFSSALSCASTARSAALTGLPGDLSHRATPPRVKKSKASAAAASVARSSSARSSALLVALRHPRASCRRCGSSARWSRGGRSGRRPGSGGGTCP